MSLDFPHEDRRRNVVKALDEFLDAAYAQVQESEGRLLAIMEASPTGNLMIDQDGVIQFINQTLERLFGYTEEELIGKKVEILLPENIRAGHPEQRNSFFKAPTMRAMGGDRTLLGRRKDGSTFPVEIGLNPVKQKDGVYALATITDVTEREKIIKDLKESNQKLEQSNEELENFAYRSSHDLKAPLSSITSLCSLARVNIKEGNYESLDELLNHIETSSIRLSHLVKDILDLSRANYKEEKQEDIILSNLLVGVKNNLSYYFDNYPVTIIEDYGYKNSFLCEKTRLSQIIENLVSNSVKYSDQNKNDPYIKIKNYVKGEQLVIEVEDNGLGIEGDETDKIFRMFYRAHDDVESSSGLGLYIVKRHVEKLQGEIVCKSVHGEGTTFTVSIPLIEGGYTE